MRYVFGVLFLVGCCAAQMNPTTNTDSASTASERQAANEVSYETAQFPASQEATLAIPLSMNDSAVASDEQESSGTSASGGQTSNGQTSTSSGQTTTTNGQTTTTVETPSGKTTTTVNTPSGQKTTQTGQKKTTTKAAATTENQAPWEWAQGLAAGVAYSYTTGSPGIGGVNVGAGWRWKAQFELCTDMDFGTSTVDLSPVFSKSKRQNYLFGGRYYLGKAISRHTKFDPFGHLMYGVTHQSVKTTQGTPVTSEISTGQTNWSWDFGGGLDYLLSRHWALRGRADWLKTHFNDTSQSHFKWVAGFWYSFAARRPPTP